MNVRVLHAAVGAITESDITLAASTGAMVIGFNVRAHPQARDLAKRDGVEIRYYSVIYNVIDDVRNALSGMLAPTVRENFIGYAQIREVFSITKVGKVAGCMITDGVVRRGAGVRLLRDDVVIHEGRLKTLKRFKDEVREVREGLRMRHGPFENYDDIKGRRRDRVLTRPRRSPASSDPAGPAAPGGPPAPPCPCGGGAGVRRCRTVPGVSRFAWEFFRPWPRRRKRRRSASCAWARQFAMPSPTALLRGDPARPGPGRPFGHRDRGAGQPGPQERHGLRHAAGRRRYGRLWWRRCGAQAPFLRGQVARAACGCDSAPQLSFETDTSFEHADRIERLLHDPEVARDLDSEFDEGEERDGPAGSVADDDAAAGPGRHGPQRDD